MDPNVIQDTAQTVAKKSIELGKTLHEGGKVACEKTGDFVEVAVQKTSDVVKNVTEQTGVVLKTAAEKTGIALKTAHGKTKDVAEKASGHTVFAFKAIGNAFGDIHKNITGQDENENENNDTEDVVLGEQNGNQENAEVHRESSSVIVQKM
jgi:hypothetical protein